MDSLHETVVKSTKVHHLQKLRFWNAACNNPSYIVCDSVDEGESMRIYNSKFFTILSSIVLVLMLGAGFHTLAQKGGHGNHGGGNGNGRGNGGGQAGPPQGGPPPGRGWRKNEQPQPQPQQVPAWANRPAPQPQYQQRAYQPQVVIQQPRGEWRQSKQEWKQERKAAKIERREWRQQPQVVVEQPRRQGPPPWAGVWTAPGQLKKAERLAERQRRVENYDYDAERQPEYRRYRQERQYVVPAEPNNYYSYGQPQPPVRYYEEPSYQYYQAPRYVGSPVYQYSPSSYYGGSIPVISYLPSYGGDDLFGPENYYYQPESFSLSDPFLGGVDWKGFLLSTVVNTLFGGRGGNEPFGYSNSPLGAIGGLFNGDEGDFGGYSPVGYADPAYGDPFVGSGGQEIYDAGYQRGLEIGRQAVISGEDFASLNDPYVLDQAGFGYGASALNLDQRRALNEGFADGYQDAVSNPNELAVNDGRGVDWTSAIIGGLLSLFNG